VRWIGAGGDEDLLTRLVRGVAAGSGEGRGPWWAVVQNGVEHRERLAPYVEEERIVPVVNRLPGGTAGGWHGGCSAGR